MATTIHHDDPDALLSGPAMGRRLNVTGMTIWRWVNKGIFPPPDFRINGRKYWREGTYTDWLMARAEAARQGDKP
jgi:predicted DNA-binding transcriptional regulator AlpA